MARGRRPDNSLEPSRQLLTQRAFRQRRAAHLAELEAKVRKLERENATLKGITYVEEQEDGSKGKGQEVKKHKSDAERRSTSTEMSAGMATVGLMEADDEEDDSELVCERCVTYEKERIDTLNAVANVDKCLLALSVSLNALQEEVKKQQHSGKSIVKGEPISPLSPIHSTTSVHSAHSLPHQYHSSDASPIDNSQLHDFFLEVPALPLTQNTDASNVVAVKAQDKVKMSGSPYHPYAGHYTSAIGGNSGGKARSHTRFSQSLDEGQGMSMSGSSNNNSSSTSGQPFASAHTYHRTAASVSATCGMAGPSELYHPQQLSPSPDPTQQRGNDCCPHKTNTPTHEVLERAKKSMMPQAREGRHLQMSGGTRRLLEQQQQQHYIPSEQVLMSTQPHSQSISPIQPQQPTQMIPHSYYDRFKSATPAIDVEMTGHQLIDLVPGGQQAHSQLQGQRQDQAAMSTEPPVEIDESKCCLGYFECDPEGNLLLGPNPTGAD